MDATEKDKLDRVMSMLKGVVSRLEIVETTLHRLEANYDAAGQGGQQGASTPQVIQPNAAAANQYVQPGTQHPYLMTGPMPIIQQKEKPALPLERSPQQSVKQDNQRNKIIDPITNQNATETLMRDALGSSRPPQADDGWNTVPSAKTQRTIYDPTKLRLNRTFACDDSIQIGPGGRGCNFWTRVDSEGNKDAKKQSGGSSGFGSSDTQWRDQSPVSKHSALDWDHDDQDLDQDRDRDGHTDGQKIGWGSRWSRAEPKPRESRKVISKPQNPVMTDEQVEQKSKGIVDEYLTRRDFSKATRGVWELPSKQRHLFVLSTLDHIMEKKQDMREAVGVLFQKLITNNLLTNQQYLEGISGVIEFAEDMAIDIPKIWQYLGEIQGAMLVGGVDFLKLQATAIKPLYEMNKAGILLAEILKTAARRIGVEDVCHIWTSSGLQWEEFLHSRENAKQFVQSEGLEFTLVDSSTDASVLQGDWVEVVNRGLTGVLKSKPNNELIFDWIEDNLQASKKQHRDFIRALVTIVCQHAANGEGKTCRIDPSDLKLRCPVLQRYIDNKRPLELQALYAVQALNHSLQNPPGLLGIIFDVLYDEDVLSEEAFFDWKKSDDPQESTGKGVALKSVTTFFTWLIEAD